MGRFKIPNYVNCILATLNAAGYAGYLVGGCVRDMILGARPGDWDIATSATPEEVMRLFRRTVPTGLKYGTVTVLRGSGKAQVTTFRTEGAYDGFRRPKNVRFIGDLREDLARRDFTINAMAMDINGDITDPYGGRDDINNGLIRCVGNPEERFGEDALRMLRAVRFSAKLGFRIGRHELSAIEALSYEMRSVSDERVSAELRKTIMAAHPEYVDIAVQSGLLDKYLACKTAVDFSPLARCCRNEPARWCVFSMLLMGDGMIMEPAAFLSELKLPKRLIKTVDSAVTICKTNALGDETGIRKALYKYGTDAVYAACRAERAISGRSRIGAARRIVESGDCVSVSGLKISGEDVKKAGYSGREIGTALNGLLEAVLKRPELNEREALLRLLYENRGGSLNNMEGQNG